MALLTVGHENENESMAKNLINLYFLNNILKCLIVILNSHHAQPLKSINLLMNCFISSILVQ